METQMPSFLTSNNRAHNTLTASYWYAKGRTGNKFMDARGEFYDRMAGRDDRDSERERYHDAYKTWRDNGFTLPMLKMILYFLANDEAGRDG